MKREKGKALSRRLWIEIRWILLGLLWLVGLGLGIVGVARYSNDNGLGWTFSDVLYSTLQLIVLELGSIEGRINWMLEMARFLLPGLTAFTALQALMHLFREQLQWLRLWRLHDHVVICGLGGKGRQLAGELLALGRRVVMIEENPKGSEAADLQNAGGILLNGNATVGDVLNQARIQQARHLICLLGDDHKNLQIAFQAYQLTRSRRNGRLTCLLHLTSPDLYRLVKASELCSQDDVPFELETFNSYARSAQILFKEDPDWNTKGDRTKIPDHIMIIGLGTMGESLAERAAFIWHASKRRGKLRITVIDYDAEQKVDRLLQKKPQLKDACRIIPIPVLSSISNAVEKNRVISGADKPVRHIFICLNESVLNLQTCLELLQLPAYQKVSIWVQLDKASGLEGLLDKPLGIDRQICRVSTFDIYEQSCSAELVLGGTHEILARGLFEQYQITLKTLSGGTGIERTWQELSDEEAKANRQQAERIHKLLAASGYHISPLQDWSASEMTFQEEEVEQMACREHDMWCETKQAAGWRFGDEKDAEKRTHPDLLPWEKLPACEQEKNCNYIRQLPGLLARIGFQIDPV